jgi:hypothetical protein
MESNTVSRKDFFKQFGLMGLGAVGAGAILTACGGGSAEQKPAAEAATAPDPCSDVSGLDENALAMRKNLEYVDVSAVDGQNCANCQLVKAADANGCYGCLLFAGPVTANGWCKNWVVKAG